MDNLPHTPSAQDDAAALRVLRQLMDLPREARADAARERVGEDAGLLQRVLHLLDQLDDTLDDTWTGQGSLQGTLLGPWRVLERIGEGGMGEVYQAQRADGHFSKDVAIKRIHGGHRGLAERFLRERTLLARLQHPHIAQLIDAGMDASGQPWLAMELVRGQPPHQWCDTQRADLRMRARLMCQLCDAVDHAHRNLVIHRDIKPGNVLVDAEGKARLLDFGIAKLLDEDNGEATRTHICTPAWSAPEQRNGEAVTMATDVYQLGLLLRFLLCGRQRNEGDSQMSQCYARLRLSDPEAAQAIASARSAVPAQLQRALHGDLDSIVALATADAPAERYRSARELREDLQAWLDGRPVRARAEERGYRLRRGLRRHWPLLAACLAGVVLTGYHIFSLNQALERVSAERERALAAERASAQSLATARLQRDRARSAAGFLSEIFQRYPVRPVAQGDVSAVELMQETVRQMREDKSRDRAVRAMVLSTASKLLQRLGRREESRTALAEAIASMRDAPDPDWALLAEMYSSMATLQLDTGDHAEADRLIESAVEIAQQHQIEPLDLRMTILHRAATFSNNRARAEKLYPQVIRLTATRPHDIQYCKTHVAALTGLANLHMEAHRPQQAIDLLQDALDVIRECPVEDPQFVPIVDRNRIWALLDLGRLNEAATMAPGVVTRSRAVFPDGDRFTESAVVAAATTALLDGDAEAANRLVQENTSPDSTRPHHALVLLQALIALERHQGSDAPHADLPAPLRQGVQAIIEDTSYGLQMPGMPPIARAVLAYADCASAPAAWQATVADAQQLRGWFRPVLTRWQTRCPTPGAGP